MKTTRSCCKQIPSIISVLQLYIEQRCRSSRFRSQTPPEGAQAKPAAPEAIASSLINARFRSAFKTHWRHRRATAHSAVFDSYLEI